MGARIGASDTARTAGVQKPIAGVQDAKFHRGADARNKGS